MTIQNILIYFEFYYYFGMTWDIENRKANYFESWSSFLKMVVSYILFYASVLFLFNMNHGMSVLYSFILGVVVYAVADVNVYALFDTSSKYIPVLLCDIFVLGGLQFALTTYLMKNYQDLFKNLYIGIIGFTITSIVLAYRAYSYGKNPHEGEFALR